MYSVIGQWPGGFQGEVRVSAGSAAISGWTVTWTFANGQTLTQAWNATVTASGSGVTARNAGYNGSLGAGASNHIRVHRIVERHQQRSGIGFLHRRLADPRLEQQVPRGGLPPRGTAVTG